MTRILHPPSHSQVSQHGRKARDISGAFCHAINTETSDTAASQNTSTPRGTNSSELGPRASLGVSLEPYSFNGVVYRGSPSTKEAEPIPSRNASPVTDVDNSLACGASSNVLQMNTVSKTQGSHPRIASVIANAPENGGLRNQVPERIEAGNDISQSPAHQAPLEIQASASGGVEVPSARADAATNMTEAVAESFSGTSTVKVEKTDKLQPSDQRVKEQDLSTSTVSLFSSVLRFVCSFFTQVKSEEVKVENLDLHINSEAMEDVKEEIKIEEELVSRPVKRKAQQTQTRQSAKKPKMMGKVTILIDLTGIEEEEDNMRNAIVID